jgi:diacylglycerol kinase family enzyme
MRALLVVNPTATATTRARRDALARALEREAKLDLAPTSARGDAMAFARAAAADGVDVVVALGGDGTVNEVVNGLLADGAHPQLPALAVAPGGSANVFSRALGYSAEPARATAELLDALRAGRRRSIGLGRADGRWFTCSAGLGIDAAVVRRVHLARAGGPASTSLYVRSAVREFFRGADRSRPALTLRRPGAPPQTGLFFAIVTNTAPWTYAGRRPVNPIPEASFDTGLDLLSTTSMSTLPVLRLVAEALRRHPRPRGRHLVRLHDQAELELASEPAIAVQVDGEYIGERRHVRLTAAPAALTVIG